MATTAPSTVPAQELAAVLKVLADPSRLMIFDLLMQGVRCNCELGDALGMAPNLISHHLRRFAAPTSSTRSETPAMRAGCTTRSIGRRSPS